jgi:hypothetical protein
LEVHLAETHRNLIAILQKRLVPLASPSFCIAMAGKMKTHPNLRMPYSSQLAGINIENLW